ncbi:Signal peptidase I [Caldisalinibacter kiritimatiensis]|uniref:Signal peptidase I n=1 Tax=Caldisalinibacter kiritimatiensis TaxID=1304284 RepID=R1CH07_9FIRM|nr:signal peptidase I [Caldisalinibacter kiritimatiensis]EOD01585.1 Signal peptidase I [Caldisalinibacter kiritimatiensis]
MIKTKKIVKEWIYPTIIALVIALLINKFVFFLVVVPTGSMKPTIMPGDRLLITRVYDKEKLNRGDIIVFYSDELEKTLVKRLIGLPKDNIVVKRDGTVYINDKKLEEPYIIRGYCTTGVFKVPEGKYLFLGDNRPNSFDSRGWENPYISMDKIKGKARFVVFPFDRLGKLNGIN